MRAVLVIEPLPADRLYRRARLDDLPFESSADIAPVHGMVSQARALEAIEFGTEMVQSGFNIFAVGASGARVQDLVRTMMEESVRSRPLPFDWVYVNNFIESHRPVAIALPGRRAPVFQRAIHDLIDDLRAALPLAFESEDYQKRRASAVQAIQEKNEHAFSELNKKATAHNIAILRTPMGFGMAPMREGKVVPPAEFNTWPESEQAAVRSAIEELEKELEHTLRAIPRREKEQREALRGLDRETAEFAIRHHFDQVKAQFTDIAGVQNHIEAMRVDLLENVQNFVSPEAVEQGAVQAAMRLAGPFDRYEVNVFVTQADRSSSAPVVEELHPTLANLVGRFEYLQIQGALLTNFRLIKPGALHRANGGVLLLDVRTLLSEPFSWFALKRALRQQEVTIEDISRFMGLTTTVTLEPDPIPLNVKVVLYGDRTLYYMLFALDPDVGQHFKVLADFDDDIVRSPDNEMMLARLIATMATQRKLRPLDRAGVARVVEHAARLAEDADKLTLLVDRLQDLIAEADHMAARSGRDLITRADVEQAIERQIRRVSRVRERGQEVMQRGIALIDTAGRRVGQVNGLSVLTLGNYGFGRPTRITCRVRPGAGKIVDIEREVELGGPLHSKGVLILSGYLAGRYALDAPMSVYASLVFEQSYGGVEGDSASSAELYALLSALAELPLRQDLAVTGSVNQHGEVQAIGGVNEKIEGFFDLCSARGLTGTQGVLIPAANAQHLMLRADVVEACAARRFAIYPVDVIDQGIALLTGCAAGERAANGLYPDGTVNRAVEERLVQFAKARKTAAAESSLP